jgi:hypothetical protein
VGGIGPLGSLPGVQNRAKRHHVVPRFYLRRWADERDRVYVVDLAAGHERLSSTESVCVRKDFYTFEAEDGTRSDGFEQVLSGIEGMASSVFRSIDAGAWPLDAEQRGVMANFIALQMARLPDLRRVLDEAVSKMNERMRQVTLADDDEFEHMILDVVGPDATDADRAQYRAALAEPFDARLTGAGFADMMVEAIDEVLQPIYDMRWTLVEAAEGEFITSDHPIFLWRRPEWPEHLPYGLFTAERAHIPISRQHVLMLTHETGDDERATMRKEAVRLVNANAAFAVERCFVLHPSMSSDATSLFGLTRAHVETLFGS